MSRFEGLENDVTYIAYDELRNKIIKKLMNDDCELDTHLMSIWIYMLQMDRMKLKKIKEFKDGRETEDSNTEIGRSNNTCDC